MHILITGADGFIGKHIVRRALRDGHSITALIRKPRHPHLENIKTRHCDLLNPLSWEDALNRIEHIDAVIHLAALMPDAVNATPEDFDLGNRRFTQYLYDWVTRTAQITQETLVPFLYFSSIGVIGEPGQAVIDESYIPNKEDIADLHPYFAGKLGGEEEIKKQSGAHLSYFILRLTSPYGALMQQKSVLPYFINQARAGKDLCWHGSGSRTQDFICVDDIADVCMKAIATGRTEKIQRTLYLASDERITMKELASVISDKYSVNAATSGQDDPQENKALGINNAALKETLGISQMTSLDEGLDRYITSLDQPDNTASLKWWEEGA